MSKGYNRIVLMGNLARDPDVRFTPQKQKCAKFTVACGREWKNKQTNEKESQTDFINCIAWGTLADVCEKYTAKGKPVLVEGRLSVRTYDKDGQRQWITEVVAENVVLLGSRDSAGQQESSYSSNQPKQLGQPDQIEQSEEEFPLDFSEMGNEDSDDISIPF